MEQRLMILSDEERRALRGLFHLHHAYVSASEHHRIRRLKAAELIDTWQAGAYTCWGLTPKGYAYVEAYCF